MSGGRACSTPASRLTMLAFNHNADCTAAGHRRCKGADDNKDALYLHLDINSNCHVPYAVSSGTLLEPSQYTVAQHGRPVGLMWEGGSVLDCLQGV